MAVTSDPATNVNLAAVIPEVWTDIVNRPNFPKAVFMNFFKDLTPYVTEGGDICHVPGIYTSTAPTNAFAESLFGTVAGTADVQTTQGTEITTAIDTMVDVTLTVNTHAYVAWLIGDKDMAQLATKYNLNEEYAMAAKNLVTQTIEKALAALWSSLSNTAVGDTTTVLSDAEIIESIYTLDNLNYDLNDCAFFVHPFVFWRQLGSVAKYYNQYASQLNFIKDGSFGPMDASRGLRGQLYGIPVYTTTNIVSALQTYRNIFAHRSAIGFAFARLWPNRVRAQSAYLLQNLATLAVVDTVFGVAVLRGYAGVVVNANNSAILS
jgi:hypothetical protein